MQIALQFSNRQFRFYLQATGFISHGRRSMDTEERIQEFFISLLSSSWCIGMRYAWSHRTNRNEVLAKNGFLICVIAPWIPFHSLCIEYLGINSVPMFLLFLLIPNSLDTFATVFFQTVKLLISFSMEPFVGVAFVASSACWQSCWTEATTSFIEGT